MPCEPCPIKDHTGMRWPLNVWSPLYFTSTSWHLYTGMWSCPDFRVLYKTGGGVVFPWIFPYCVPTCVLTSAPRLLGLGISRKLSCGGERSWYWLLNIMASSCEWQRCLCLLGFSVGYWGPKRNNMRLREMGMDKTWASCLTTFHRQAYVWIQI